MTGSSEKVGCDDRLLLLYEKFIVPHSLKIEHVKENEGNDSNEDYSDEIKETV